MSASVIEWNWHGERIVLGADAAGAGPRVLLLPALSSISTRHEMRPLQERLSQRYATFAIDWPGFGDRARPQLDWAPEIYSTFLSFLLQFVIAQPHAIIAAGHAATYLLKHAASSSSATTRHTTIRSFLDDRSSRVIDSSRLRLGHPLQQAQLTAAD